MKNVLIPFALAILISAGFAADPPSATDKKTQDPVVGRWRATNTGVPLSLNADGTAADTRTGKWVCLNPRATPRKYQVTWGDETIDTVSLVKNGKELVGENQDHFKLRWTRIPQ